MLWSSLLCCLALAGTVSAGAWQPKMNYRYTVETRTLTALHQVSDQYTGALIRAQVDIKTYNETTYVGTISSIEHAVVGPLYLPGGWNSEIPKADLEYNPLPFSDPTFLVAVTKDNAVEHIWVNSKLQTWEKRMIWGIVSQFQIRPDAKSKEYSIQKIPGHATSTFSTFYTVETSNTGKCVVGYTISPLSIPAMAKTPRLQNFTDAERREHLVVEKFWNYGKWKNVPKSEIGMTEPEKFSHDRNEYLPVSRSTKAFAVIRGNVRRHTIISTETINTLIVAPELYNKQKGIVATVVNFYLDWENPLGTAPKPPQQLTLQEDIANADFLRAAEYTTYVKDAEFPADSFHVDPEREYMKDAPYYDSVQDDYESSPNMFKKLLKSVEDTVDRCLGDARYSPSPVASIMPYHTAYQGKRIGDAPATDIADMVAELAGNAAEMFWNQSNIQSQQGMSTLVVLVKVLRTLTAEEIRFAYLKVAPDSIAGKVLRSAVGMTGTRHSLAVIYEWIDTDHISKSEAADLISNQKQAAYAQDYIYLWTLFKITQSVDKQGHLGVVSALTYTDILRTAAVKEKRYRILTRLSVEYFAERLTAAIKRGDSVQIQLEIRALGNIADIKVFDVFYPYVIGAKQATEFQRLHMIASMDRLTEYNRKPMGKFWQNIYANATMPHQFRCLAVFHTMKTNPSAAQLQKMAEMTHIDISTQFKSAVASMIKSAAALRGPYHEELAQNAKAALSMLKLEEYDGSYSKAIYDNYKIGEVGVSYAQFLETIGSTDSLMPSAVFYKLYQNYDGYRPETIRASAMVSSLNDTLALINSIFRGSSGTWQPLSMFNSWTSGEVSADQDKDVYVDKREQVEGNIMFPFLGHQWFWAFDNHTIQKVPQTFWQTFKEYSRGKEVGFTKLYTNSEVAVAVYDELGFQHIYSCITPVVAHVNGTIRLQAEPWEENENYTPLPLRISAYGSLNITYAVREEAKIGFITPYNSMDYISGMDSNAVVHLPLNGSVTFEVNEKKEFGNFTIQLKPLKKEYTNVFHLSSWPYTTKLYLLSNPLPSSAGNPNNTIIHVRPPTKRNVVVGKPTTGMGFRYESISEADESYISNIREQEYLEFSRELPWWSMKYRWLLQKIKGHNLYSILHFPYAGRSIYMHSLNVSYDPEECTADTVTITATSLNVKPDIETKMALRSSKHHKYRRYSTSHRRLYDSIVSENVPADYGESHFLLNTTFEGETRAAFGMLYTHRSSPVTQSYISKVVTWYEPVVYDPIKTELMLSVNSPSVHTFNFIDALEGNPNSTFYFALGFGAPDWNEPAIATIQGSMGRTPKRRDFIRDSAMGKACIDQMGWHHNILPICQKVTTWANSLDHYEAHVKYEHIPAAFKRFAYSVYAQIRQAFYPNIQEDVFPENPSSDRVNLKLQINNEDTAFNFNLESSLLTANGTDIQLQPWGRPFIMNAANSYVDRVGLQNYPLYYSPSFVLDNGIIVTLDNKTYSLETSNCWRIALAHAPKWRAGPPYNEEMKYAVSDLQPIVFVRYTDQEEKNLEVRIFIDGHQIDVLSNPTDSSYAKVYLNSQTVEVNKEQETSIAGGIRIHLLPGGEVVINFNNPFIHQIIKDNHRLQVKVTNRLRSTARGLAGDFDGESIDEFIIPENCIVENSKIFADQWNYCDGGIRADFKCVKKQQIVHEKKSIHGSFLHPFQKQEEKSVTSEENGSSSSSSSSSESHEGLPTVPYMGSPNTEDVNELPILATHAFEEDGAYCFSIDPIHQCKERQVPREHEIREVAYHCTPINPVSTLWYKEVHKGVVIDFSRKRVSKTLMQPVATSC